MARVSVRIVAGMATVLIGVAVLLAGLLPPHLMETGQIDPRAWFLPMACGAVLLLGLLRWVIGAWRWTVMASAMLALAVPPLIVCLAGSAGQAGRLAPWLSPVREVPQARSRPMIGVLSGPVLHGPASRAAMAGFSMSPLWKIWARAFRTVPLAALHAPELQHLSALLLVQPRGLAPEELVALDDWVRQGGRAVLLADPDLRWADARPLGHPLRPPPVSLLDPLLHHWGMTLAPAPPHPAGDPVERRFLADGSMLQIVGASRFIPARASHCALSSGGLVARCTIGKGIAILVADADFANDALWTADPAEPGRTAAWTSDVVPVLADWLAPGTGAAAGRRVWLTRADGLPGALRPALLVLLLLGIFTASMAKSRRTKQEL
ncbi:MAG TPA: hypothetical protein VF463_09490 [Sphingobium sp.]